MRIDIVGRHLEVTDAIREKSDERLAKLTRYNDKIQQITMTLAKEGNHGHESFEVELVIEVEHHETIIARVIGDDLYNLIEQAAQKATRQLRDFKEQLKPGHHR